jgi:NAD(P)-dependent dehydrogenase (short-subunit alcohol dehydrogenase family)
MKLSGKNAIITGASQGLGLAIAQAFVREGANVLICARDSGELEKARRQLSESANGEVAAVQADVSVDADLERLQAAAADRWGSVNVLVANAGVYGPKGGVQDVDWGEWRRALEINLFGTVQACRVFLPMMLRSGPRGKIILLSGGGATKALPFLSAYAASKAAVVRFGETLAEELRDRAIDVNMVAPGALNTRLLQEVIDAGPERVGKAFYETSLRQKESGGTPFERGAELCVYLASAQSDGISGRLISAIWDPWPRLHELRADLEPTDIYTLRRITPEDRGKRWE